MNNLIEIIQRGFEISPDIVALQIKEGSSYYQITYKSLLEQSKKIAYSLQQLGLKKTDTVGILSENSPNWGLAFFGIIWGGFVTVPIDNKLKDHSILNIIEHSECKAIFVSSTFRETINTLLKVCSSKPLIITLNTKTLDPEELTIDRFIHVKKEPTDIQLAHPHPNDLAIILYTSGTTGSPKGVMLTHANLLSNVISVTSLFTFSSDDHFVSILPLCHTYAITADFLSPLTGGAQITYVETFKGNIITQRMQENNASVLIAVPALLQVILKQIQSKIQELPKLKRMIFEFLKLISRVSLSLGYPIGKFLFKSIKNKLSPSLKFMMTGGAPIDPRIIKEFFILGIPIYQGYGLTESSPILTVNAPGRNQIGSVGKPIPGVQIKIIEQSEIVAKGPNIMKGYYKNSRDTNQILKNGWLYTGDIGRFDSNGFLYITGRIKNIIVTRGGKNVSPEELEEELCRSPWIKEACVIGLIKKSKFNRDEIVYAILVPNLEAFQLAGMCSDPPSISDPQIVETIQKAVKLSNSRMPDYKHIRGFELWEELSKTTSLKVKRKDVLDTLNNRAQRGTGMFQ